MSRLVGPVEAQRTIQTYDDGKQRFTGYPGRLVTLYTDAGMTQLADVRAFDSTNPTVLGAAITGSKVSLDRDSRTPVFWFPDGVTRLYGQVMRGGPAVVLDADPASFGRLVGQLPTSYYCWHRGAQRVYPENSREAFRASVANGATVLKFDVYRLADNALVVSHDATVDRVSTSTGNVSSLTTSQWMNLVVDAGSWFAPAWPNLQALFLDDVLREFGGRAVLIIDSKATQYTAAIIAAVQKFGLQSSVMLTSSDTSLADAALAKAAGIPYRFYWNGAAITSPTPTAAMNAGATHLAIGLAYSDADIAAVVAAAAPRNVPVQGFSVNRRYERDRFQGLGVTIYDCNDPQYVAATVPLRTTDNFAAKTPHPGLVPSDSWTADTLVPYIGTPGRLSFAATSGGTFALLGFLGPLGTNYTISGTLTPDVLGGNVNNWAALVLSTDDRPSNGNAAINGYNLLMREGGAFQVYRQDPGAVTNGVTASGTSTGLSPSGTAAAMVAATPIAWSVTVSPTQIVFTVGGQTVTVSDATYRPLRYLHVGKASGQTLQVSYSGISVS